MWNIVSGKGGNQMSELSELYEQGVRCHQAAYALAQCGSAVKDAALARIADVLLAEREQILQANAQDIAAARAAGRSASFIDRLALDEQRIEGICAGVREKSVPIGVIGIIFEARPNVCVDAAALCLKSGNVCYLRGSRETIRTNRVLVELMRQALKDSGLNEDCIALVLDTSHAAADDFMKMNDCLDLLIPRGSARLIEHCVKNATVPLIETGSGNCIIYVDRSVDADEVIPVIINAKCQRVSVCNACESLLIHRERLDLVPGLLAALKENGVKIHADETICAMDDSLIPATEADYGKEYLDYEISIHCVDSLQEAIDHINAHHTMHSDAILSNDPQAIERFMNGVDAAVVYANASTRFSDGNEFGFGAEIGISTLRELTTYKYQVYGKGTIRK